MRVEKHPQFLNNSLGNNSPILFHITVANLHRTPIRDLQRQTRVQIVLQITVIGASFLRFFYPKDTPSNTTLEV